MGEMVMNNKGAPLFDICLITKNEAKTLPTFCHYLEEFSDRSGQINILDTGSTDNTPDIARSFGCNVKEVGNKHHHIVSPELAYEINNTFIDGAEAPIAFSGDVYFHYGDAMNDSISMPVMSGNDMIFQPDADEYITKLDIDEINRYIILGGVNKFEYDYIFINDHRGIPIVRFWQALFFNKKLRKRAGVIHGNPELIDPNTLEITQRIGRDILSLEHKQSEKDRSKYLLGIAVDAIERPNNERTRSFLGRELWWNGRPWSGANQFKAALNLDGSTKDKSENMMFLGDICGAMGQPVDQIEWFQKAFNICPEDRQPLIKLAQTYQRKNYPKIAKVYAMGALGMPWEESRPGSLVKEYYDNMPHELLYWAEGWLGNIEEAQEHLLECLRYDRENPIYLRDIQYYFNTNPKVSICIPSLGRPEKLQRLLESIKENAEYDNYEVFVRYDQEMPNNIGAPKILDRLVKESTGELVLYLGNDCIACPGFLREAVAEMSKRFPRLDGLVALNLINDSEENKGKASHWLASKKLLPSLGGAFFDVDFNHTGVDIILERICRKLGKYTYAEKAHIIHGDNEPWDKYYLQSYFGPRHDHDDAIFTEKLKYYGIED